MRRAYYLGLQQAPAQRERETGACQCCDFPGLEARNFILSFPRPESAFDCAQARLRLLPQSRSRGNHFQGPIHPVSALVVLSDSVRRNRFMANLRRLFCRPLTPKGNLFPRNAGSTAGKLRELYPPGLPPMPDLPSRCPSCTSRPRPFLVSPIGSRVFASSDQQARCSIDNPHRVDRLG